MSKRKGRPTPKRGWQPLQPAVLDTASAAQIIEHGVAPPDRIYVNDRYSVFVREMGGGYLYISFHRHDRSPLVDWRHKQAIKNEVAGPERTAVEIFPPESALVDAANETHLWVIPEGTELPFMENQRLVLTQGEAEKIYGKTRARQRAWEPGLPTGKGTV